jgi:transcriptional regulator of arginine metabolism
MAPDEREQFAAGVSAGAQDPNRDFMHWECINSHRHIVNTPARALADRSAGRYAPGMANKRERQAGIRDLISSRAVESQEELRRLLKQRGWAVTQSTLSRDLREMRVARVPAPGGTVRYALTGATTDDRPPLEALLPHLYTEIGGVGEMVVLHTLPGGAQPIGVALDAEEWPEVLGSVAGDDTVLIICRSAAARERLTHRLRAIAGAT